MIEIVLSALAALVLLVLAAVVFTGKKEGKQTALAVVALLLAGLEVVDRIVVETATGSAPGIRKISLVLESLLPLALLWYGFSFSRRERIRIVSARGAVLLTAGLLFPGVALLLPADRFFYSPDFQTELVLFLRGAGYWFYLGLTFSCIMSLVNVEATFSATAGNDRGKIKFEVIGMAGILAVLLFYFSQALLYRTINATLIPVRSGVLILAVSTVLLSKLFRGGGVRVSISRYILYRSVTLSAVGCYFMVLGLVGEAMTYFEVPFARYLTLLLAFAGSMALLAVLLSERSRRGLRVLVNKHFFAHKHDYRETWLALTNRLAACATRAELERAIPAAYLEILGLRAASLYLLEKTSGKYLPAGRTGPREESFAVSARLLSYFLDRNRVWNPFDGEYVPTDEERAAVRSSSARLVVPLLANHHLEGIVMLGEEESKEPFTYEDYDLMKIIARQSALLLSDLRLSEEIMETRELAAMARVSSFVAHDLKNLTQTLCLLLDNAEEHMGNSEFQRDMLITMRHTVGDMKKLTQKLNVLPASQPSRRLNEDLHVLAESVLQEIRKTRPRPVLVCRGDPVSCSIDAEELKKVVINLVQNAIEATGEEGTITVETGSNASRAFLRVSDNGCGMAPDFIRAQLFKPFRSTKKSGMGIGLYHCRQIVQSFDGAIEVTSERGKGSSFTVILPVFDRSLSAVV